MLCVMTKPKYTTRHPITGETVDVDGTRRENVTFATWANWGGSEGWGRVGVSMSDNLMKATKSARSAAPYALDWTATPVTRIEA